MQEEDSHGFTRIFLLVSPEVGDLDEKELLSSVGDELRRTGRDSGSCVLSMDVWDGAGTFGVRREYPRPTRAGKILTFQVSRKP